MKPLTFLENTPTTATNSTIIMNGQDPTSAELLNQVRAKLTEEIADLELAIKTHLVALKVLKSRLKKLEK